jgi:hypothetical protein
MKKKRIWVLSALLLAALISLLICVPAIIKQPLPEHDLETPPATAVSGIPSAGDVKIGEISYTIAQLKPDPALEQAILDQLGGYTNCEPGSGNGVRYFYNVVDLNNDSIPETIVYLVGRETCGSGGCTTLIFRSSGDRHELISHLTLTNNPIIVSHQTTNGWRDLVLYVSGGGAKASYHRLRFTGNNYPENPSVEPVLERDAVISGDAYIANKIMFDTQALTLHSPACDEKEPAPGLMHSDSLGDLRIDMPEMKVSELLGEPGDKGEQLLSEADALYHQEWRYPRQGIFLELVSESADGKQRVASIRAGLHSIHETTKGIKVGDSFAAVNKAYGDQLDADNSDPPFTLLAGSLYGGVLFSFEEGKVIQIFLGAAAE